jgi:hypothetical protein
MPVRPETSSSVKSFWLDRIVNFIDAPFGSAGAWLDALGHATSTSVTFATLGSVLINGGLNVVFATFVAAESRGLFRN